MFELITPLSYWLLSILWLIILCLYFAKLKQLKTLEKTVTVLLVILAIDAFRTLFESLYFGLYFNSLFGLLPASIHPLLSDPTLLIIPKLLNVLAALVIITLLIRYWMPRELRERQQWLDNQHKAKLAAEKENVEAQQHALRFQSIFNGISDAIVLTDINRNITTINKGFERIFGYTTNDLAGKKTSVFYESDEEYEFQGRTRFNMSAEQKADPYEANYRRKNGQFFVGETLSSAIHDAKGEVIGFIGVIRDITLRKKNQEKLKLAASVFTHAREGIIITDASGAILDVNDTFSRITGYSKKEVLGLNPRVLKSGEQDADFYTAMWQSLLKNQYWDGELWNKRKNGEIYAVLSTISAVCDANKKVQQYVALFLEITDMKDQQKQLEHIAHYDPLTDLPNRVLLADRLHQAINQCQRRKQSLAVAYLDLDGFKQINDTYGHDVGDDLLIAISRRMKEVLREGDTLARLGGDEFVIVLVDIEKITECEAVLSRLLKAAVTPFIINNKTLSVSSSIGITFYPQDAVDADQLMRHADNAMYVAKQSGKNRYHLFDVYQDIEIQSQTEILENIKIALSRSEFILYYQPKLNMQTGEIIGFEALIRWQHPERGVLPASEFLPLTENHPLSEAIGEWVIEQALSQMNDWQLEGLNMAISVNVSARQLQHKNFISNLSTALSRFPNISPHHLELEILEISAIEDITEVSLIMHACRKIGISLALDDFGTGFSSLTHLRRLPADMLKIDQSFVRDMLDDPNDRAIVSAVIALATSFNRQVIAEGVETTAHGAQLLSMGCLLAQGYGIAKPMPASEIPQWLSDWQSDSSWSL